MNTLNGCRRSAVVKWKCFTIVQTSAIFLGLEQSNNPLLMRTVNESANVRHSCVCGGGSKQSPCSCVVSLVHLGVLLVCWRRTCCYGAQPGAIHSAHAGNIEGPSCSVRSRNTLSWEGPIRVIESNLCLHTAPPKPCV